ncbi:hypothetical protein ACJX0J_028479, partial [Zea mays]
TEGVYIYQAQREFIAVGFDADFVIWKYLFLYSSIEHAVTCENWTPWVPDEWFFFGGGCL